jgi:hypothetical protein
LPNVQVVNDVAHNFTGAAFDTVLVVGVLEYSRLYVSSKEEDPVLAMLRHLCALLAPGGQLVVAIENQLGLKYFAGSREDHLGRRMLGIEDLYSADGVVTFGREELSGYFERVGLSHQDWYYPFPDYKLPACVVADAAWSPDNHFNPVPLIAPTAYLDPNGPSAPLFDTERAWNVIYRNRLGRDVANSFLVRASAEPLSNSNVLAWHFGLGDRRADLRKRTTFVPTGDGIEVRRDLEGQRGASRRAAWAELAPEPESYVPGSPWTDALAAIVGRGGWTVEQVDQWMTRWFSAVCAEVGIEVSAARRDTVISGRLLDALPRNLIVTEGGSQFVDLEWRSVEPLTVGHLVVRALIHDLVSSPPVARPAEESALKLTNLIPRLAVWRMMELDGSAVEDAWVRELEFQRAVTGSVGELSDGLDVVNGSLRLRLDCDELVARAEAFPDLQETIGSLRHALWDQEGEAADSATRFEAALAQRDGLVDDLNRKITGLRHERDVLGSALAEAGREHGIRVGILEQQELALRSRAERVKGRMLRLDSKVNDLKAELRAARRSLAMERRANQEMESSRSWRLARTIHRLAHPFRR